MNRNELHEKRRGRRDTGKDWRSWSKREQRKGKNTCENGTGIRYDRVHQDPGHGLASEIVAGVSVKRGRDTEKIDEIKKGVRKKVENGEG